MLVSPLETVPQKAAKLVAGGVKGRFTRKRIKVPICRLEQMLTREISMIHGLKNPTKSINKGREIMCQHNPLSMNGPQLEQGLEKN